MFHLQKDGSRITFILYICLLLCNAVFLIIGSRDIFLYFNVYFEPLPV